MVAVSHVDLSDLDRSLALAETGYLNAQDLLRDALRIVRHRLGAAVDMSRPRETEGPERPSDLLTEEALVQRRIAASEVAALPIAQLRTRIGLSASEERVLWILIAHELCPTSRGLVRELNTEQVSDATTDALRRAVYGSCSDSMASWSELAEEGALRRFQLIERTDGGTATPLHRQTWKVADRILGLVHGEMRLDPSLAGLASLRDPPVPLHQLALAGSVGTQLTDACARDGIVIAFGRAASGRRSALEAVLADRGVRALVIEGRAIAKDREVAARELRLLARECTLLGVLPLIRDMDALAASGDISDRIDLVELRFGGLVLGTANRPVARPWRRATTQVELPSITGQQRADLWQAALPAATPGQADGLANLYPLAPGLIDAAGTLIRETSDDLAPTREQIASGLRSILDDRLAGLATRVAVTQTWEDMVLPDDQFAAIVELMARIRERRMVYEDWGFAAKVGKGLGVAALFSGPPGTGKTMAAGLVARELEVELYQVDLSKVVSKWIGETEKNLAALFDAAEAGHAILLFDEADALFGKRTDVKSSNDRYANQEVNFLLQRLESFAGVAILTTNHTTAIDEAFRRRLSIHVQFPMPDTDERLKLWRVLIPSRAPTRGNLGFEQLAERYVMSAGYIRNAVLRAAFLAVADGSPIQASHLSRAAQLEYEAMGKIASRT